MGSRFGGNGEKMNLKIIKTIEALIGEYLSSPQKEKNLLALENLIHWTLRPGYQSYAVAAEIRHTANRLFRENGINPIFVDGPTPGELVAARRAKLSATVRRAQHSHY